jgi:hypothetical protein
MQLVSHASTLGYVVLGGSDFNAHLGNLADTHVEQLDWHLPTRVPVTVDGNVAEVHNVVGNLLMDTCRACSMGVATGRVQPDITPCTSFTHRNTQTAGRSRPDHFVCSHQLFTGITTSDVMHNVGGSDHLPVSLHMKRPTSTQHPHQSPLRRCPPVLKWRGPETLYSSNVQQAIANGSMKASLDSLPVQGPAAATAALLEVIRQSALSAGQPLLQRCCPQLPRRFSAPWFDGTCARLRRQYRKQCRRFGAHHPEASTSFIATVQTALQCKEETLL